MGFVQNLGWGMGFGKNLGWEMGFIPPLQDPLQRNVCQGATACPMGYNSVVNIGKFRHSYFGEFATDFPETSMAY